MILGSQPNNITSKNQIIKVLFFCSPLDHKAQTVTLSYKLMLAPIGRNACKILYTQLSFHFVGLKVNQDPIHPHPMLNHAVDPVLELHIHLVLEVEHQMVMYQLRNNYHVQNQLDQQEHHARAVVLPGQVPLVHTNHITQITVDQLDLGLTVVQEKVDHVAVRLDHINHKVKQQQKVVQGGLEVVRDDLEVVRNALEVVHNTREVDLIGPAVDHRSHVAVLEVALKSQDHDHVVVRLIVILVVKSVEEML